MVDYVEFIYYFIGSIGILSNVFVLAALLNAKSLRKKITNMYIINQSCIDLSASIMLIITYLDIDVDYTKPAGNFLCLMWKSAVLLWSLLISSTYNLVMVSIDRYLQIVHPIWHKNQMSRCKAKLMLMFAWISGFFWKFSTVLPTSKVEDGECKSMHFWPSEIVQHFVGVLGIILQFFVPLGILIYTYTKIILVLNKKVYPQPSNAEPSSNNQSSNRAQRNVIKTLIMISVAFVLCWIINQIMFLYYNLGGSLNFSGYLYHISVILVFLNCCINPFVYMCKYDQFKRGVVKLVNHNQVTVEGPFDETSTSRM